MNIDWSKAPDGATHYNNSEGADWYKRHEGRWFYYDVDTRKWERSICIASGADCTDLIPRPTSTQQYFDGIQKSIDEFGEALGKTLNRMAWNGKGNPPIGTEVEYKVHVYDMWENGKILAYHDKFVWILEGCDNEPCTFALSELEFRRIKTERDQQIDALLSVILSLPSLAFRDDFAAALYDKGVRVQV